MISGPSKVVNLINKGRLDTFQAHVQRGGRYLVDLGSGDGRFAIELAIKTQRWLLGIDKDHPTCNPDRFNFTNYTEATSFVFLERNYRQLLDSWGEFDWLQGKADKLFMILPYPSQQFIEEIELIGRLLATPGELHIRTEQPKIFARIKALSPRPLAEIPFAAEAKNIYSSMTVNMIKKCGELLVEQGFRVL